MFEYFLQISDIYGINAIFLYLIIGIAGFIILKTQYILIQDPLRDDIAEEEISEKYSENHPNDSAENYEVQEEGKFKKLIRFLNLLVLTIRNLFFNILNDFFIVTLFWTSCFLIIFVLSTFNFLNILSSESQIIPLLAVISVIGVMGGLFQIYYSFYKNEISSKVTKLFQSIVIQHLMTITDLEFSEYVKSLENSESQTFNTIILEFFSDKPNILNELRRQKIESLMDRSRKNLHMDVNLLNTPIPRDPIVVFQYLEDNIQKNDTNGENYKKLLNLYEQYFDKKMADFSTEMQGYSLDEIKKYLLTNIVIYEDSIIAYSNLNIKSDIALHSFSDYYQKHATDCIMEIYGTSIN